LLLFTLAIAFIGRQTLSYFVAHYLFIFLLSLSLSSIL
jgi:hypothetical protein